MSTNGVRPPFQPHNNTFSTLQARIQAESRRLAAIRVHPTHPLAVDAATISGQNVPGHASLEELLRRPHVHYPLLLQHGLGACQLDHGPLRTDTGTLEDDPVEEVLSQEASDSRGGQAEDAPRVLVGRGAAEAAAVLQEPLSVAEFEAVEISIKYSGFIHRQAKQMRQVGHVEDM